MVRLKAQFDGKVLIPEGTVNLPTGVMLDVVVQTSGEGDGDNLLGLVGLGEDVWDGIDPLEYQRREREGWE